MSLTMDHADAGREREQVSRLLRRALDAWGLKEVLHFAGATLGWNERRVRRAIYEGDAFAPPEPDRLQPMIDRLRAEALANLAAYDAIEKDIHGRNPTAARAAGDASRAPAVGEGAVVGHAGRCAAAPGGAVG